MASIKISELEEVTKLSTSDVLPIINENKTKKVSLEKLNEILGGSGESGSGSVKMLVIEFDNNLRTFDTDTNKAILTEYYNSIRNDEFVELFIAFNKFSGAESGDSPYWYRASVMELDDYYLKLYCPSHVNTNQSQNIYGINYHEMSELEVTASVQISGENYSIASIAYHYNNSWALNSNNKILGMNNITAFTPTGDYNPATKKYVDDAVANIEIPESGGGDGIDTSKIRVIHMYETHLSPGSVNYKNQKIDALDQQLLCDFINESYDLETSKQTLIPVIVYGRQILYVTEFGFSNISDGTTQFKFNFRGPTLSGAIRSGNIDLRLRYDTDKYVISSGTLNSSEDVTYLKKYNTDEFTPTGDYNPATKKYVDDAVANIEIPESGGGESSSQAFRWDGTASDEALATFQQWWQCYLDTGVMHPITFSNLTNKHDTACLLQPWKNYFLKSTTTIYVAFMAIDGSANQYWYPRIKHIIVRLILTDTIENKGTVDSIYKWSEDQPYLSSIYNPKGAFPESQYDYSSLALGNTHEFTPTGDYNPATKKYVDDAVKNAITSVLEAEY